MAGLQRFITYIYKYENDEKKENAGFAKIEIRGTVCRVEVHIRNISMEQPEATVYLFAREKEIIQGIPVGTIEISRGSGDVRYAFDIKELLNFEKTMRDMEGIFIPLGEAGKDTSTPAGDSKENLFLASQWKEGPIAGQRFRILEKRKPEESDPRIQGREEAPNAETEDRQQAVPSGQGDRQKQNQQNPAQPENNHRIPAQSRQSRRKLMDSDNSQENPAQLVENQKNFTGSEDKSREYINLENRTQASADSENRVPESMNPENGKRSSAGSENGERSSIEEMNRVQASTEPENGVPVSAKAEGQEALQAESIQQESIQKNQTEAGISPEPKIRQSGTASMSNIPLPRRQGLFRGRRNIRATELPMEEFFEDTGWERIFQKLRLKLDIFFPFEGQEIECVRMQLNDLQEFPKKYWYLCNNSFLLHGFFNYRHIIFGERINEERKEYFIGVPGVFQNQERIMASMFGFPEFSTAKDAEYKTGNFGYWYRIL